ncbi:aminopeptidase P family protein [Propionimicrobium sp. PCR01-08-3]|uniref:aminopeptidase P family protein n=1 Tax=Propionimicrobium sp. PCR01-08-3 TaxID=3052086 RepID=UPI00255C6F70|nr:aminopeptidase P family protein [Propionimicrobium sp. PCR01-08-3]WIY81789.1 aminopeptidase P family protein [Propionimicrobium sp. PCR01-08-3]
MANGEQKTITNRNSPFSDAFKKFICDDWAPYSTELPAPVAGATAAAAHRKQLSERYPGERLIIPAGGLKPRNNDCDYRFRPHSAFTWLTGLGTDREPDAVLVMEPAAGGHRPILYFHPRVPRTDEEFYADSRYGEMWVGQRESLEEMAALGQIETASIDDLEPALQNMASQTPTRMLRETDPKLANKLDAWRGRAEKADAELVVTLSELRLIKDDFEVDQLRQACRATAVGFEAVVRELPNAVAKPRGERWAEGVFGLHARHLGNAVGYDTIAASGDHANTLHWIVNDGDLHDGDLMLMDAGVELDSLFTADVTRTMPVNGHFTDAQRKVYDAVRAAQQAGFEAAKPGALFSDVHQAAVTVIASKLAEWGVLPVSADQALDPQVGGQYRRWMVHGTSHHLGLDVHDCAQALRQDYRGELKPGMVITVEPGIYFKSTDLMVPEELRGIGVRIEDDILITEDGCEILSDQLPRESDDVEAWMAGLLK